jgi:hypothetical protein
VHDAAVRGSVTMPLMIVVVSWMKLGDMFGG